MRLHPPINKDQMRIYDMVRSAMPGGKRRNQYADPDQCVGFFLRKAAMQMNKKITCQAKRIRRAEAAVHYGLIRVAEIFSPAVAHMNTFHPERCDETPTFSERSVEQVQAPIVPPPPPAPVIRFN